MLAFEPAPHVGQVLCTVTLTDAAGSPAACTAVVLEGNMNHAGMVPVFTAAHATGNGQFAGHLEFTMGGDWLIFTRGRTDDGRAFEVVTELPGVPNRLNAPSTDEASDR